MPIRFDPLAPTVLDGDVSINVLDPDGNPNMVLELNQPWSLEVTWYIDGPTVSSLGGTWEIKAFLESMGPGFENQVGPTLSKSLVNIDASSTPTHLVYKDTIAVPAGTPPDEAIYRVTTTVTYRNIFGNRMAMAGFSTGPMIQFYSPV